MESQTKPREVPVDLAPIDGLMQAQFKSQQAPEYVMTAWDNFVDAVATWKTPKGETENGDGGSESSGG